MNIKPEWIINSISAFETIAGFILDGISAKRKSDAEDIISKSKEKYEKKLIELESQRKKTTDELCKLAILESKIQAEDMNAYITLYEKFVQKGESIENEMTYSNAKNEEVISYDKMNADSISIDDIKNVSINAEAIAKAGIKIGAGPLSAIAVYGGAKMFGKASTGTAINTLTGVVSSNATLAWLGGGPKSIGGGGIEEGKIVLGGVVFGTILFVSGVISDVESKEKMAEAEKFKSDMDYKCKNADMSVSFLESVESISYDYYDLIVRLRKVFNNKLIKFNNLYIKELEKQKNTFKNIIRQKLNKSVLINFDKLDEEDQYFIYSFNYFVKVYFMIINTPILNQEDKNIINKNISRMKEIGENYVRNDKILKFLNSNDGTTVKENVVISAEIIGNELNKNLQNGSNSINEDINKLFKKALDLRNVPYEQEKGNLFEYIEAAKFNRNAANRGEEVKAFVTDADGRPHSPVDIEILKNGKVIREVQAKVSKTSSGDIDTSATSSVHMQTNAKYKGMQRLIRKDNEYISKKTGAKTTLLEETKRLAEERSKTKSIYAEDYKDTYDNLVDELTDDSKKNGIKSGGTTLDELKDATEHTKEYGNKLKMSQYSYEIVNSAIKMSLTTGTLTCIVSSVKNLANVYNDKEKLKQALINIGVDTTTETIKSAGTGALAATLRVAGLEKNIKLLKNGNSSVIIAGNVIDSGVALYDYIAGNIDDKMLKENLENTLIKSITTIYFSNAATSAFGTTNAITTIIIYSIANYIVSNLRSIFKESKLRVEELKRYTELNNEAITILKEYHKKLIEESKKYKIGLQICSENLLNAFEEDNDSIESLSREVDALNEFACLYKQPIYLDTFEEYKEKVIKN